jgi:hypothetical protein
MCCITTIRPASSIHDDRTASLAEGRLQALIRLGRIVKPRLNNSA